MQNNPQNQNKKISAENKKDRVLYAVLICMMVIIIVLIILLLRSCPGEDKLIITELERDSSASIGQLEGKTEEEIQEELNRVVAEGMFNISINPNPIFENGEAAGNLRIENIPANHYNMTVKITLDETGEVIYQSGVIEPNYHIENDTLDVVLPKGNHNATATFTAYRPQTDEVVGQVAAKIIIIVQN